jgi:squalene synthase HpnC
MSFDRIDHYENFPVASILAPARLRRPIAVIYHFARSADDLADEGDAPASQRLASLDAYRIQLDRIARGHEATTPLFRALQQEIVARKLPVQPFRDLLDAFSQDVVKSRYADFAELLDYCRRSANPVGRLMLYLFDSATPQHIAWSDAICTALQLINFWQDVGIDWGKGRVYLPQDELQTYGVTEAQIETRHVDDHWRQLMQFQITRTTAMLESGAPLGDALTGRAGLEIRAVIAGGRTMLRKLHAIDGQTFYRRPQLRAFDWIPIVASALFARSRSPRTPRVAR